MEDDMTLHTIVIRNAGLIFRARPAYLKTVPGDQVKFSNYAGATALLTFPAGLFDQDDLTLTTAANKDTLTVQDVADGPYPYSGTVNGVPILGESSPEIIVDR
jgi:hypothetical protein